MPKRLPRRSLLLAVGAGLLASCGGPPPGNPDPGNQQLRALAADSIFARLPPSAVRTSWHESPAKYLGSVFSGPGWDPPTVRLTFTSAQPARDVYRFYQERARETDWTPVLRTSPDGVWWKVTAGKRSHAALAPNFNPDHVNVTEGGVLKSYSLEAFS
jgi:hypothetical protein